MAAISGVMRSLTSAVTTAPKATPMTTATARSTTFPRRTKFLNPFMNLPCSFGQLDGLGCAGAQWRTSYGAPGRPGRQRPGQRPCRVAPEVGKDRGAGVVGCWPISDLLVDLVGRQGLEP